MRVLLGMKLFKEVDVDVFQPQPAAAQYTTDAVPAQMVIHLYVHISIS